MTYNNALHATCETHARERKRWAFSQMLTLKFIILVAIAVTVVSCSTAPVRLPHPGTFEKVLTLATSGDPEAIHTACYRYLYGEEGAPMDLAKAAHWCERASALGIPPSIALLAEMNRDGKGVPKNAARARQLYEQAANLGHPHAQLMIAVMCWNGEGGSRDIEAAKNFINRAVAQNYPRAIELRREFERIESAQAVSR